MYYIILHLYKSKNVTNKKGIKLKLISQIFKYQNHV